MQSYPDSYPMDYIGRVLRPVMNDYDYILFDTSPSFGGLQERAIWASKWVIIPTSTEYLSLDGLQQTRSTMEKLTERGWKGKGLGVLPTFYDVKTRESQEAIGELRAAFPKTLLSPIHRATVLRECAANSQTVFEMYPRSRAAQDYQALADFVLQRTT
jgi:chromosome partitioning protein